jgi:hypothetical protein
MRNVLYKLVISPNNEIAQRWEIINNFRTGAGVAISWQVATNLITVSRTVAHGDYKEAKEAELQLLIKIIFKAAKIHVWDNVKWDT